MNDNLLTLKKKKSKKKKKKTPEKKIHVYEFLSNREILPIHTLVLQMIHFFRHLGDLCRLLLFNH